MTERAAILFVEVPELYAEVELRDAPALVGQPVLVGGDPAKRGKLQSASREALEAGVSLGQPIREALAQCPDAVLLRTDMARYREAGGALQVSLRRVVASLEPAGLGAAYIDGQATQRTADELARALIAQVRSDLDLPLRIGIAPTKMLARLVAETVEKGGFRRIDEAGVADFLDPLPVARLPRVGRKAIERLAALGARTIGELRGLAKADIEANLGNHGLSILEQADGADPSRVRATRHASTISRSETLDPPAVLHGAPVQAVLHRLARDLELALTRQGLRADRLAIRLGFEDGPPATRSATHGDELGTTLSLHGAAEALLSRVDPAGRPIRTLALRVAGLRAGQAPSDQLELF